MPPEPSVTSASEAAAVMHLEVLVGAVAKELRAARPEVGKPGDVLLGRRGGCLVEWISVCVIVVLLFVEHCRKRIMQLALHPETIERKQCEGQNRAACSAKCRTMSRRPRARRYLEVGGFCPYLSMPSRLIFDSSVCRGIPSFAAAPEGPAMRPWVSARAASIISIFTICQRRKALVRPRRLC